MIIDIKEAGLSFDFSHCFSDKGLTSPGLLAKSELSALSLINSAALDEIDAIRQGKTLEHNEKALFLDLPFQNQDVTDSIKRRAEYIRNNCRYVISFGIGGSYLGSTALIQAIKGLYYNLGNSCPKLFFLGNNLDPQTLREVADLVEIDKLHLIIISKSGSTLEPLASFSYFYNLMKDAGLDITNRITIITGSEKSILRTFGRKYSLHTMIMPENIGGRFSVLSVAGLLNSAVAGIDTDALLRGARDSLDSFLAHDPGLNPALLYAGTGYLFHKKGIDISVIMPYSDRLQHFGLWYIQLFSESLGKKGIGRTPMLAVGTTDMHSQTQQHQEGRRDKCITFIQIEQFRDEISVKPMPEPLGLYKGKFGELLKTACLANQRALYEDSRPSCCITMRRIEEKTLGSLIMFFEISTVFEGIMLGINPFDQPGVEQYKKIMKEHL